MKTLSTERCVDILERGIVEWCAPTLAGLKPASMFNVVRFHHAGTLPDGRPNIVEYTYGQLDEATRLVSRALDGTGVRLRVMARRHGSSLVFAWRPELLAAFIGRDPEAIMLEVEGYDVDDAQGCVDRLQDRILDFDRCPHDGRGFDRFPHEVGFMLGYPLDDVMGFVRHRQAALLRGCWNVYSDVARARRIFGLYDACTLMSTNRLACGEKLASIADVAPQPAAALLTLYDTIER